MEKDIKISYEYETDIILRNLLEESNKLSKTEIKQYLDNQITQYLKNKQTIIDKSLLINLRLFREVQMFESLMSQQQRDKQIADGVRNIVGQLLEIWRNSTNK